jgi:hypothetical protein
MQAATVTEAGRLRAGIGHGGRASRLPPAALVALLCLALEVILDALLRHESGISGDERFYTRMAAHPGGPHNFPYAFRIVVPWLVHLLPFSHVASFTGLALVAIAVSGGAMYALLMQFRTPGPIAVGLAVSFALAPTLLVVLLRHGRSVDAAVLLVLTLGSLFIVRRQKLALALTLIVGAGVHESCLFLIPFAYAIWARRPVDWAAARDTTLIGVLPIVIYLILRSSITAVGIQYIPGYSGPFLKERWDIIRQGLSSGEFQQQVRRVALAYGPIWVIAPFALGSCAFARRGLVLVVLCLGSMTFAFGWGRIMFFAAPVFYVATAHVIRDRRRLALATIVALLAFDLAYAIYMQAYGVQHGIDPTVASSVRVPVY